jgi:hypothetical protein
MEGSVESITSTLAELSHSDVKQFSVQLALTEDELRLPSEWEKFDLLVTRSTHPETQPRTLVRANTLYTE